MKVKCDVCNKIFPFPLEINEHRHKKYELDGVPYNTWTIIDYVRDLDISVQKIKNKGILKYSSIYQNITKMISLGEGNTPLIKYTDNLFIKDESGNPTGSFKDRGMPFLMNEVLYHNKKKIAIASTGNAGISLVKYAKKYNLESIVFVPRDLSEYKKKELAKADKLIYSDNLIKSFEDFVKYCDENEDVFNGFLSTNISYLIGLQTMSYEILEQLNEIPDYIVIPCASGGNVVATHLAWKNLFEKGITDKIPKIIIVQILGGNPIEQGYSLGMKKEPLIIGNPADSRSILSSDTCFNYFKIYEILEQGYAETVSITDEEIDNAINKYQKFNYDYTSMGAFAGYEKIKDKVKNNEKIVIIATAKRRD